MMSNKIIGVPYSIKVVKMRMKNILIRIVLLCKFKLGLIKLIQIMIWLKQVDRNHLRWVIK